MISPLHLRMVGLLAVANTLAISVGIEPMERNITPRDAWDDDEPRSSNPFDSRKPRPAPEPIVKSGERYDKAEAKRQRKADKRIRNKFEV